MARKRMIDPNIWESEDFSKLSTLAKLVFIGMFSNADDEGRGKAKPVYLKSKIFPYNEEIRIIDIDKTLSEISSYMSVTFYSCNENEYYVFDNWAKWQKIDRPTISIIPALDDDSMIIRRVFDESSTNVRRALVPNIKEKKRIEDKGNIREGEEDVVIPKTDALEIFKAYNNICKDNPEAKILTDSRRVKINARLKEVVFRDNYKKIFEIVSQTDFLKGVNDRQWKADFDWLIENDKNYVKVLEGKYATKTTAKKTTGNPFADLLAKEVANEQNGDYTDFNIVESSISNDV